ncbi:unnamed protein product [Coffea canephora]|uniref:Cytochrome P450 n=1 Tax=Coffea canephora TaxID=49390 RepID=A0A068UIT9_COFCA|nr:unnamed protein product [Coffea canephora]
MLLRMIKLGKLDVPAGTPFYLALASVHHDEARPRASIHKDLLSPGSIWPCFFPLGLGTRICVGQNFVLMEARIYNPSYDSQKKFDFAVSPSRVHPHPPVTFRFQTVQAQYSAHVLFRKI